MPLTEREKLIWNGRRGRPMRLTDEAEQLLLAATRNSLPIPAAAEFAGVGARSVERWLSQGRLAEELVDEELARVETSDDPLPEDVDAIARRILSPVEYAYFGFWTRMKKARADSVARQIARLNKAAEGGFVTEETTETYRDRETGELVTRKTVKRQPPDWRASKSVLEMSHRAMFGKDADVHRVELTGPDGGPVAVGGGPDAADVARRIHDRLQEQVAALGAAAATSRLELPAGEEPIDAEVVDDE